MTKEETSDVLPSADYLNDTVDARKGINEVKEDDGGNAGSALFSLSRHAKEEEDSFVGYVEYACAIRAAV